MEKIFDIAKDSEKSWGVIAQGIDGNFDELSQNVAECKTDMMRLCKITKKRQGG